MNTLKDLLVVIGIALLALIIACIAMTTALWLAIHFTKPLPIEQTTIELR